MKVNIPVTKAEVLASLRFIRTHLYAAQAQLTESDDAIVMRHIYDAYKRVQEVCREVELNGIEGEQEE